MKRIFPMLIALLLLSIFSSCGPSEKEMRAKIEQERQDSIRVANEKAEAERIRIQQQQEEERRQWESSQVGKGWSYLKGQLKSPSTAELVNWVGPDNSECESLARKIDLPGLSVAMYRFNAQNSYGAMLEGLYLVFFKNGTPVLAEDATKIPDDPYYTKMALELRGY